jgi:hypothetical protein
MPAFDAPKAAPPTLVTRHDSVAAHGLGSAPEAASTERRAMQEAILKCQVSGDPLHFLNK